MVIDRFLFPRWINTLKCTLLAQRSITLMWLCRLGRLTALDIFAHGRTSDSLPSYSTSKGLFNAVLGSYVDDGFGGARTQAQAQSMIDWLYAVGHATGTAFNKAKTCGPATRLVILGCSTVQ